jgi:hypothetical protein
MPTRAPSLSNTGARSSQITDRTETHKTQSGAPGKTEPGQRPPRLPDEAWSDDSDPAPGLEQHLVEIKTSNALL